MFYICVLGFIMLQSITFVAIKWEFRLTSRSLEPQNSLDTIFKARLSFMAHVHDCMCYIEFRPYYAPDTEFRT
ncbi:MAG: hypothetical protein ACD_57C00014G0003 [uncultured bacterium]|nr:MAG: hypothetical protein ACD_57C00014G0003 [uncultured bacterium]